MSDERKWKSRKMWVMPYLFWANIMDFCTKKELFANHECKKYWTDKTIYFILRKLQVFAFFLWSHLICTWITLMNWLMNRNFQRKKTHRQTNYTQMFVLTSLHFTVMCFLCWINSFIAIAIELKISDSKTKIEQLENAKRTVQRDIEELIDNHYYQQMFDRELHRAFPSPQDEVIVVSDSE